MKNHLHFATGRILHTGARPTPRHKLAAATPHRIIRAAPPQSAFVPKQLSMWGNDQYGDCVSAEEAFNKACATSEIFISDATVIDWARQNGFLDGANLTDVMDSMAKSGMVSASTTYGDGGYTSVDYSNEPVLQNALSIAPVKIGIDSTALPSGAGNQQGWSAFGGSPGQYQSEDHCVALAGYGPADFVFGALGVPVPSGAPSGTLYMLYTWSTIGVVDHAWIMSTVGEAWLRNPTSTANGQPLPNPGPTPGPVPVPPGPTPVPPGPTPGPGPIPVIGVTTLTLPDGATITVTPPPSMHAVGSINWLALIEKIVADILAALGQQSKH